MKSKKVDWALIDIVSQKSLDLSEQDFDDIQSAIGIAIDETDRTVVKGFIKRLKRLERKLWKLRK